MRAIGYIRLSRADPDSTSPKRQRAEIERYCKSHDLTLAGVYEDIDVSGTSDSRKGLEAAIAQLGEGDRLLVWKLDRLYRSVVGFADVMKRLSAIGAYLSTTDGQIDMSSPMGEAMVWITAVFAQLEVKMMGERSKNMHSHLREQGRWATSRVPFGWRKADGHLVSHPEEQATLTDMASAFARGDSLRDVGRRFGREHTSIRHMLRSDRVLEALPPDVAQGVRSELQRRGSGYQKGSTSLLGGIGKCGVCGAALKLFSKRRNGSGDATWAAYGCRDKGHVYIDAAWLDQYVSDAVVGAIDVKKLAKKMPRRSKPGEATHIEERLDVLEQDFYERGLVGRESYLRRREALLKRLEAAREAPSAVSLPRELALHLREEWPGLSLAGRRRIIAAVLDHIVISKATTRGKIDPTRVVLVWR